MERLTARNELGGAYYKKCFEEPCYGRGERDCNICEHSYEICERLAEYEDLGITPEQGESLIEFVQRKCRKWRSFKDRYHLTK